MRFREGLHSHAPKVDLLNRISILALKVLDHIADASAYGLLHLRLVAERDLGGEGFLRPGPGCLPAIAVRDGVAKYAIEPCDGAFGVPDLSAVLDRLNVNGL